MKKIISVLCAILVLCVIAAPVFATNYTADDIIAQMKAGVTINGVNNPISDKYVKVAQDFFNSSNLTQDELNTAMSDLLSAKKVWEDTGVLSFAALPANVKTELQNMAIASANKVGATLTVDGTDLSLVNDAGKTYTVTTGTNSAIKQTGVNYSIVMVFAALFLLAISAVFVVARKNRLTQA